MNSDNKVDHIIADTNRLTRLKLAIAGITPDRRHRVTTCFVEAYLELEEALEQQKPLKLILEMFNQAYDLNVSPQTFRKMITEARERQGAIA